MKIQLFTIKCNRRDDLTIQYYIFNEFKNSNAI